MVGKDHGVKIEAVTQRTIAFLKLLGMEVSRGTLYRWSSAVRADNLWGLIDQRGLQGRWKRFGRFFLELERYYSGPGLLNAELCHELACKTASENGWPSPVLRDSKRYLKKYILPGIQAERNASAGGAVVKHKRGVRSPI